MSVQAKLLSIPNGPVREMGHVSRIVTIIEGVQVIEVTTHDSQGDPLETHYVVRGEEYETLKQAMRAARGEG